jgi:hypothetical protein
MEVFLNVFAQKGKKKKETQQLGTTLGLFG